MQATRTQPVTHRCNKCGSANVVREAHAKWNDSGQYWKIIDICDDATCLDCGAEGADIISEAPL